jgi:hypothetical protein
LGPAPQRIDWRCLGECSTRFAKLRAMRIGKPLLLILTPIGVIGGLYEAWRLAGGLVFLMLALLTVIGVAIGTVVATIRRERAEELQRQRDADQSSSADKPPPG